MGRTVGIDLSPGRCALVELSGSAAMPRRFASLDVGSDEPERLAGELRRLRREQHLSRTARAVVWSAASLVPSADGDYHDRVTPLATAGFTVERLVGPAEGLAMLAGTLARADDEAVGYLAVNPDGAALAIVRRGELLLGDELEWTALEDPRKLDPRALGRRLGAAIVKIVRSASVGGFGIDRIALCGAHPQLRALALPLNEVLGRPVETLDTLEGVDTAGLETSIFEFQRQLPGLRLAWAAAADGGAIRADTASVVRRWWRPTAALLATAATVVIVVACWPSRTPRPTPILSRVSGPATTPSGGVAPPEPARAEPARSSPMPGAAPPTERAPVKGPIAPLAEGPAPAFVGTHKVEMTLVSGDRCLALVDGRIVGPGDRVGRDLVVEVGAREVVFSDANGGLTRVPFRAVAHGVSLK